MFGIKAIQHLLEAPAPGFRCFAAGDESGPRFVARIHHTLHEPTAAEDLSLIREVLGTHAEQLVAFYAQHDGCVLYGDTLSDAAGIELLPVGQWQDAREDMREMFEHLIEEPDEDPDRIMTGVAFATVPGSGNYFVIPVEGPAAGRVFYADHDGWYEAAFADDFDAFVSRVAHDPVRLLSEDLGCYTRYSDGKSEAQWIPEVYDPDVSSVA
jgi:hypothetical protein